MKKAFLILLLLLAVSLAVNVWLATREATTETTIERDTMWRDSMIYLPQPAETIPTDRVVYIRIPSPCDSVHNQSASPEPVEGHGTAEGPGTVGGDSIDVPIPIYQKRYDDSLYTAWVSGYEPALDSISLHLPEVTTTITQTVVKPSPLVTFGIQAGAGYGFINRKPDLYIGIGGQLNLWRK
jgi:hypothetical protein